MKARHDLGAVLRLFHRTAGPQLLLGAALSTATVIAGIALLGLSGWFITATALAGLATASALAFNVFLPSAGVRMLALGRTAGRYAERLVTHDATLAVLAALREHVFRGWSQPHAARALLRRPARLLFRLTADIDALETLYLRLLVPALAMLGAALVAGLVLGALAGWLGVLVGAWLLALGLGMTVVVAARARAFALRRAVALERLRERTIDLVAGQTDLVMAGRLMAHCASLAAADARLGRAEDALHRLETGAGWIHNVAAGVTLAAVLLVVGALAGEGAIGAPAAALALLVSLAALEPLAGLRRGALEAGRAWLAARRLAPRLREADGQRCSPAQTPAQALANRRAAARAPVDGAAEDVPSSAAPDAATDAVDVAGELPRPACSIALDLRAVSMTYTGAPTRAVRDVSLRIADGERVALIGPSGGGKSTLLALAAGEVAPQRGAASAVACTWLTQRTELFQDSLRDNLRLADPSADDERLWSVLEDAGLARDVRALPHRLDTLLGECGLGLSGGQSRRLALARLLLRPTRLWLLDEPTEALDAVTARDVLERLSARADGRALLIATHLRREAALADRLLRLQGGRVVADLRRGTAEFDVALRSLRHDDDPDHDPDPADRPGSLDRRTDQPD